jgi:hypothetical protein
MEIAKRKAGDDTIFKAERKRERKGKERELKKKIKK